MIVRGVDTNNDWLFGKGRNDYKTNLNAIIQNIKTRLQSFLGDCFFAQSAGVDWFNLLGGKDRTALQLEVSSAILNTEGVTKLNDLSITENRTTRRITLQYNVDTVFSRSSIQNVEIGV